MNIICFLTLRPSKLFYQFCKKLINTEYDVYICIDDNSYNIPDCDDTIKIIKIDNNECIQAGFKSSVLYFQNQACSRDKALYYFCKNEIDYNYIWFIEEDVFLPTADIISNLDNKYHSGDLLCREHRKISLDNHKSTKTVVYTNRMISKFVNNTQSMPFANLVAKINLGQTHYTVGMISAIRMSKTLMNIIKNFAAEYNTLFIDEALFTTLSYKNNLNVVTPNEFNTILFNKNWNKSDININNLYHPIKNTITQYEYRNNKIPIQQNTPQQIIIKPPQMTKKVLYYKK